MATQYIGGDYHDPYEYERLGYIGRPYHGAPMYGGASMLPSASAVMWDRHYAGAALAERPPAPKPEATKIELPADVKARLEREDRKRRADAQKRKMEYMEEATAAANEQREAQMAEHDAAKESVAFWKHHLTLLHWWQRAKRRETRRSLTLAHQRLHEAGGHVPSEDMTW